MTIDLTDPIFHDEEAARLHMEAIRWPNGPFCPHCGSVEASRGCTASHTVLACTSATPAVATSR